jgi:hypothetical protein
MINGKHQLFIILLLPLIYHFDKVTPSKRNIDAAEGTTSRARHEVRLLL